jgi:hypothetical protein
VTRPGYMRISHDDQRGLGRILIGEEAPMPQPTHARLPLSPHQAGGRRSSTPAQPTSIDRLIYQLAQQHDGLIPTPSLLAAGFCHQAIRNRLQNKVL